MKKIERYVCEICHTQFDTEEEAKNCEAVHEYPLDSSPELIYHYGSYYPMYIRIRSKTGIMCYKQTNEVRKEKGVPLRWEENQ